MHLDARKKIEKEKNTVSDMSRRNEAASKKNPKKKSMTCKWFGAIVNNSKQYVMLTVERLFFDIESVCVSGNTGK